MDEDYKSLNQDVLRMNADLKIHYGCLDDDRPIFRIVWSEDLLEVRQKFGRFATLKKYNYLQDRFILERLMFGHFPELPNSANGIYEPLYIFQDKNNNFLPPLYKVAEIIISALLAPKGEKRDLAAEERKAKEKEVEFFENYLNDVGQSALFYDKSAVFISGKKDEPTIN